jgi:hypothetical protein
MALFEHFRHPGDRPRGLGDDRRGSGEGSRGLGDFRRGPGDNGRGLGEDRRAPGDRPRGPGEDRRGPGAVPRGPADGPPESPNAPPTPRPPAPGPPWAERNRWNLCEHSPRLAREKTFPEKGARGFMGGLKNKAAVQDYL